MPWGTGAPRTSVSINGVLPDPSLRVSDWCLVACPSLHWSIITLSYMQRLSVNSLEAEAMLITLALPVPSIVYNQKYSLC